MRTAITSIDRRTATNELDTRELRTHGLDVRHDAIFSNGSPCPNRTS